MEKMMHLAAQYLATAGISFLPKKDDDSHTNLGFSIEKETLFSRPLNNDEDTLSLNYTLFALEWHAKGSTSILKLDNKTHAEILQWISAMVSNSNIKTPYSYTLHYELPYEISDGFTFKLTGAVRLKELLQLRVLAQSVLESVLEEHRLKSEIRIWPHHFDTGAFTSLANGTNRSVGFGLSIPDSLVNDHYFYVSGYHGHDSVATEGFAPLTHGKWYTNEFKGGVLPASGIDMASAITFFNETLSAYKN